MSTTQISHKYGPYILGPTLGEGGYSKVKLGTHEDTGMKVALKIMKKDGVESLTASERDGIQREIEMMQRLEHDNIIKLIDFDWEATYTKKSGASYGAIIIILELAAGGELFNFIATTGAFSEKVARSYFRQLIEGVAYCHSEGIIHRDLKPENLLMDANYKLKLADFGFSVHADDLLYSETGTKGYMAPEIFNNQGYEGAAADIWACGIILFIMVAAFPPLQVAHRRDWWFDKLLTQRHNQFWWYHERNARFSPELKDLINRILCPYPDQRATLAVIQQHPWFAAPIHTTEELKAEMTRRVQTRDGLRPSETNNSAPPSSLMDEDTTRALPSVPPSFATLQRAVNASSDMFDSHELSFEADSFEEEDLPPAPVLNRSVACYTALESDQNLASVWSSLQSSMQAISDRCTIKQAKYKVKAQVPTTDGQGFVEVVAQVYAETKAQNGFEVQLRRGKGDQIEFLMAYHAVRARMAHTLRQELTEQSESEKSSYGGRNAEKSSIPENVIRSQYEPEELMFSDDC